MSQPETCEVHVCRGYLQYLEMIKRLTINYLFLLIPLVQPKNGCLFKCRLTRSPNQPNPTLRLLPYHYCAQKKRNCRADPTIARSLAIVLRVRFQFTLLQLS